MAQFGVGASLASLGSEQLRETSRMLAEVSRQDSEREQRNRVAEAQAKAGKRQLGGTLGAAIGGAAAEGAGVAGPWGSLIGGVVGAVAGGLF